MLILVAAASLGVLYLVWSTRKRTGGVNFSNSKGIYLGATAVTMLSKRIVLFASFDT